MHGVLFFATRRSGAWVLCRLSWNTDEKARDIITDVQMHLGAKLIESTVVGEHHVGQGGIASLKLASQLKRWTECWKCGTQAGICPKSWHSDIACKSQVPPPDVLQCLKEVETVCVSSNRPLFPSVRNLSREGDISRTSLLLFQPGIATSPYVFMCAYQHPMQVHIVPCERVARVTPAVSSSCSDNPIEIMFELRYCAYVVAWLVCVVAT